MIKSKVQYCCDAVARVVGDNRRTSLFVNPYSNMDTASQGIFKAAYTLIGEGGIQSPEQLLNFIYSQYSSPKSKLIIPEEKHQYVDVYLFFYAVKAISHFSAKVIEDDPWLCGIYAVELYSVNNGIQNFISENDCEIAELKDHFREASGMSMMPYELLSVYTEALYQYTSKPFNGLLSAQERSELYDFTGLILSCFIQ